MWIWKEKSEGNLSECSKQSGGNSRGLQLWLSILSGVTVIISLLQGWLPLRLELGIFGLMQIILPFDPPCLRRHKTKHMSQES